MKLTSRSTGVFASTRWVPPVTGVLFLTLVVFAGAFVWQARQMDRRHQFTAHVQEAMEYLNARIEAYNALLRGVAAFAHVHQPISDQAFHDYVAHLQLRQNYPGIQGIGLAARLGPGDPPDATSRIVSWSSYSLDTIWPKGDGASERFPIALLEPRDDRNQKAMGFDMFSEPVRRQAMEQARDTGRATATGRVTLVQEDDTAPMPGFLIYLPLYESAPPPPGESRKLLGFIYAPFRAGDMLGTVLPERLRRVIDVQVYAGEQTDEQSMLFATTPPEQTDGAKLRETRMLDVAGRIWTLHFVSTQPVSAGSALPLTIVGFGLVVSTALFLMSRSLARARDEAERSAQQLLASQRDLHDSRERYRLLLKAANDVTWEWDFATGTIRWNEALRSLGYEPSDPAFDIHAWEQHIHPDDRQRVIDGISACMHDGPDYWSEEYRFERGDGRLAHIYDRGYILRDAQAKPLRMIGAMTDLTHIKEAQEQLRRANETLESRVAQRTASLLIQQKQLRSLASQLTLTAARERRRLAHILHDHIQQLLVAAKMRLSLVRDQVDGPPLEQVAGVFDLLEESIQSSRSLAVEISPPVLYDAGLIAALHWLERRKMGEYQLRVTIDADPDAEPQAEVVRVLLFEATRELLFNVVKHAETLDVTVRLRRLDGEVELSVRDEGVGFDPSRLEQAPGDAC
jgi:PAS domain S-box-containing protein